MASVNNDQIYKNVPRHLTLADVSEKGKNYPAIVSIMKNEYELKGLPHGVEILLEKPEYIHFVRIKIVDFEGKEYERAAFEDDFIKDRKRYIGEEFLIPLGYRGKFKLLSKIGRYATLISVSQIIQDLPRFIKIEEDTSYTPPGQSHATTCIPAGTKLEVKRAFSIEKNWYIECQSETLNIYRFSEDFPLNCTCVDDPEDHTFLNITKKSILLPKKVRFLTISSTDVLTSDAKEATTLLKLIGGPIKILETDVRRKVFIAWLKSCDRNEQSVALIPSNIWKTQTIELKTFTSDLERQDYIRHNFGEHNEFSFVVNGLYTMCPKATDVVWIKAPYTYTSGNSATGRAVNYENTDDDDTEYVKLWTDSPVIPPRPKSFRNPSVPHVTKGRTVHVEQNVAVKGREPHPGRSPKAQHENISAKEKSKKGLDNIDTYYNIEGKAYHSLKETTAVGHEVEQDLKSATLPDLRKSSEENQTEEDFYSYSVEELVECFKLCGMNKLAIDCSANKLDGAFFREFNVDDLLSEPFCLNKFQVSKVKMIIENGWRPKSDLPK